MSIIDNEKDSISILRTKASEYHNKWQEEMEFLLTDAADTIESISTKLQAANTERSTAHHNGGWIPCSERLPECDGETVLIQLPENKGGVTLADEISVDISFIRTSKKEWVASCGRYKLEEVIAWKPIEPYHES